MIKLIDLEALKVYDTEIKNYIDKFNSGTGVDSFCLKSAEAIGDHSIALGENSKAIADNSIALGLNSMAGIKGYYFSSIDFTTKAITLTKQQGVAPTEPFSVNYAIGDVISLNNGGKYPNCSTITAISNNIITVDSLPFTSVIADANPDIDEWNFYVIEKPEAGEIPLGWYASAIGENSRAIERSSYAEGRDTLAYGQYSHAEGRNTKAGYSAHAEGRDTIASGEHSHAEGNTTKAIGNRSHAEGQETVASGYTSHVEGYKTTASGATSHSEGNLTIASGANSHSEGKLTSAIGENSHAEGQNTEASGNNAHAEGYLTTASAFHSHAEGQNTKALGNYSHSEGYNTEASGSSAHSEGRNTTASGNFSHAEGNGTIAKGIASHAQGKYNIEDTNDKYAHIVGNGTTEKRSNAHTLDWNGNAWFAGNVTVGTGNSKLATEAVVDTKIAELVGSAPETLDTLNELAQALGDDPNFATTIATQLGQKVDKVDGKGLSTEDYTTAEKEKLASLANYDDTELVNLINDKIDKSAITTVVNGESTNYAIPTARATFEHAENIYYLLNPRVTATENSINQINETITTKTNTTVPETLAINTIYDLGEQTSLTLTLPSGQLGDFIQVDFLSTATPTTLTITATSGLSDYDLIPEANTIYSLYFNWIRLDATTYGWGFGYAEYTRTVA